jgi:HK97 family phage major capsid protein
MQAGVPDSLFGYPIEINQDMPAMTTGLKPILFGDFNEGYLIRDVRGFQLLRMDERWADFLQVGFLGFARSDGLVRNAGSYRAITMA